MVLCKTVTDPAKQNPGEDIIMKQLFCLALVMCLLLCACASPDNGATSAPAESQSTQTTETFETEETQQTEFPTEEPTQETTEPPTQPPVLYTNPLTGEALDTPMTGRPFAVMLNNIKAAMPQHGVSQADILYEILAEGNITRCMGIFSDVSNVEALGSIRSARKYYVDIAQSYDAVYVHAGGSDEAYAYMSTIKCDHIDGVKGANASKYYYRDKDRLNSGYSKEHTMFITGAKAVEYATKQKCTLTRSKELSYGLHFDAESMIMGSAANKIKIYFVTGNKPSSSTKTTTMTYKAEDGLYYAYQHGKDYIDGNTGETVAFKNVIVLKAKTTLQDNGKLRTIELTGSGEGYFACNGQLVPIKWSRESLYKPFVYTLENGAPLTLSVGSTYIGVIPTKGVVEYE
jgi:hypothetical protein